MNLCRLVYCSERNASSALDVKDLIRASRKNNGKDTITGILHYNGHYFIQVLEGGRAQLSSTYHRIINDPRHHNIQLISFTDVRERLFSRWSMGLHEDVSERTREIFLRYFPFEQIDPTTVNVDSLLDVLQDMAAEL